MGADKALVEVDGVAMAVRVARCLQAAGARSVACIGGDRGSLGRLGLDVVEDRWPGEGPLGGLATALAWTEARHATAVVVAGCDQPWLDAPTLARLLAMHAERGAGATVYAVGGVPQPLPGVYEVDLLPRMCDALAAGERALTLALRLTSCSVVDVEDMSDGVDPRVLRDVDRPEDLRTP